MVTAGVMFQGWRIGAARRLDVVASGLPFYGGRTIVVDATLRSPLTGAGMWRFNADEEDGATFAIVFLR